jgi:D-lactate dehydrogenase
MKIAFFEMQPWEREYISSKIKKHTCLFFEHSLTEKDIPKIKECDALSVFIHSKINKETLDRLPKLKLIATRSTGFDHINLEECKKSNITLTNVPFYGENTVAEHAFALILSLSRNIHKSYVRTINNNYSIKGLTGFDLKGKTLGLIGSGAIGLHIAKMAKGFGIQVIAYDIIHNEQASKDIGFSYTDLEYLLKNSDIISLHVPYNKHTHHLLNENNMKNIKKGAIIINTSRGGIIDTEFMLKLLKNKHLLGAGLDVIEGEEHLSDKNPSIEVKTAKALFKMDNVIFTSHNAFNSKEALVRILDTTIKNLTSTEKHQVK